MKNIAFLFTGIGSLAGGGGAERFFSGFFERYKASNPHFRLFFITDKLSLKHLREIGSMKDKSQILVFSLVNNRFKNLLEKLQLMWLVIRYRIGLVQVPLYHIQYYPLVKALDRLPRIIRPKIVFTVTDSFLPHFYFDDQGRGYNFRKIHEELFNTVRIDAVISWYELFKTFATEHRIIKSDPEIYCISSRYSDKVFDTRVKKKNQIVFASRLTIAKRPMMFIEAIRILKQTSRAINDWHFFIYGKGNLEEEIKQKIREYDLPELVTLTHHPDLTRVFEESRCFVSTQDFENFPSLAMNEAMAAGNAIIARNVGQTDLFVKHGLNGLLMEKDHEEGLAEALNYFITHPELHESMALESVKLTTEVHTFENFKTQMEAFWAKTLN